MRRKLARRHRSSALLLRGRFAPSLEQLEERTLCAIGAAAIADDAYEENDSRTAAFKLGLLQSTTTIGPLALADSADWYRFSTGATGTSSDYVGLAFKNSQGNLDLELYDAAGTRLKSSATSSDSERISLSGMKAGEYSVRVFGSRSATNPNYTLTIDPPTPLVDDDREQNDSQAAAHDLGTLTSASTINNLAMADSADWYRFRMQGPGSAQDFVSIAFQNSQGNLDLELYDASAKRLRTSTSSSDSERVSLSGYAAGDYFVRVFGKSGAFNPSYSLTVEPGAPLVDDAYEENDTRETASNLGAVSGVKTVPNLVMADSADWFRFETASAGKSTSNVVIKFDTALGNLGLELYDAAGTRLKSSNGTTGTETVSLSGLAAGVYYAKAFGTSGAVNPKYELTVTPPTPSSTTPPPATTSKFNIEITYSGFTASQRAYFESAKLKWQSVIVGDLPDATYKGKKVDDILIAASAEDMDGLDGLVGWGDAKQFRSGTRLPYYGTIEFDTADIDQMIAGGTFYSVIVHEIGHALGFGIIWDDKGLLAGEGTSNSRFLGPRATAEYNSLFGKKASGVPLETGGNSGTEDVHWSEAIFGNELMTGYLGPGANMPLSRITVASMADLGYVVDMNAAESYTPPGVAQAIASDASTKSAGAGLRLGDAESATRCTLATCREVAARSAEAARTMVNEVTSGLSGATISTVSRRLVQNVGTIRSPYAATIDQVLAEISLVEML